MFSLLALLLTASATPSPEATCLTAYGQSACGYDCTAGYGKVRCASVPHGSCTAAYGDVVCGPDPLRGAPVAADWEQATCISAFGKSACGYDCKSGFGEVGCAPTPWGACVAAYGGVTCSGGDATLVYAAFNGQAIPQATCTTAFGRRACGYGCVAARGQIACAATPWAVCEISPKGQAVCSDTPAVVVPVGAGAGQRQRVQPAR